MESCYNKISKIRNFTFIRQKNSKLTDYLLEFFFFINLLITFQHYYTKYFLHV